MLEFKTIVKDLTVCVSLIAVYPAYCTKTILHVDEESGTTHESTHGDSSGGHGTGIVVSSAAGSGTSTALDSTSLGGERGDLILNSLAGSTSGSLGGGAEGVELVLDRLGGLGKGRGNAGESAGVDGLGSSLALGLSRSGSRGLGNGRGVAHSGGSTSGIADARRDLAFNSGGNILDDGGSVANTGRDVADDRRNIVSARDIDRLGLLFVS